jgi:hypothetical protein
MIWDGDLACWVDLPVLLCPLWRAQVVLKTGMIPAACWL